MIADMGKPHHVPVFYCTRVLHPVFCFIFRIMILVSLKPWIRHS